VIEREFVITSEFGLHARPAGQLAALASKFEAEIEISNREEWVNAQSVLSLLSLAAGPGTSVSVRAEGAEAEQAMAAIADLVDSWAEGEPDAGAPA